MSVEASSGSAIGFAIALWAIAILEKNKITN